MPSHSAAAVAGVESVTADSAGPAGPEGPSRRAVYPMWSALSPLGDPDLGFASTRRQNPVVAPWAG